RGGFPRYLGRRMMVLPNPVAPVNCMADTVGGCPKLLLNVGRLTEQKDQRTLVEAFARTAPAHPDWILRIVGEGNLRRQLERVIAGFGLQDRVQLAGVIEDMEREYCSAQLFAVASRYESFGLATAEALSAGIPAIGFADCPGTNELIQDGLNGLLVGGPDRVAALAAGLDQLMGSTVDRVRLGIAAPTTV